MKYLFLFIVPWTVTLTFGQSRMPYFLQGTWKVENKEIYEHWDKLNSHALKGFSYQLKNGQMEISEYVDISERNNQTIYTAVVINQNEGKEIEFRLTKTGDSFTFENPDHDFPKSISYQRVSDNEMFVSVSDGKQNGFSYKMTKQYVRDTSAANPNYDKTLADRLGGDEYGMKSYFFIVLKTGPNTTADEGLVSEAFRGHLDNINRLVQEGKLIVAGPMGKNENNYRGIFILNNIESIEDAKTLLETDLAIKNGLLDYEIFTWYGSAALPEYLPASDKIWKLKP